MKGITALDHLLGTTAELNGVHIPGRSLQAALATYGSNLFVFNNDPIFRVLLRGTTATIRYGDRYLLLATQHQLEGVEWEEVGMLTEGGQHLITTGGARSRARSAETDAFDIVAFDFTEPMEAHPAFRSRFFTLDHQPPDVRNDKVITVALVGFPFDTQGYDLAETNQLKVARHMILCDPEFQPSDLATLKVKPRSQIAFNPDGMSGGPAFVVYLDEWGFHAAFAGLVLRGGAGESGFYILKVGYVLEFLRGAFPA